jgi:hypothetical protein
VLNAAPSFMVGPNFGDQTRDSRMDPTGVTGDLVAEPRLHSRIETGAIRTSIAAAQTPHRTIKLSY